MITRRTLKRKRFANERRGGAAVECALVAPLLILMVIGAIEVGRFINVAQTVNDASREGGRLSCRNSTTSVAEVESAVKNYLFDSFPNLSNDELDSALTVIVRDSAGDVIEDDDLTTLLSGDSMTVEVSLDYDAVQWLKGFSSLGTMSLHKDTTMRRE